jgi:hypothetical protein
MKTVRRTYLYLASFISMQLIGWGAILWLRQLIDQGRKYSFHEWGGLDGTATFVAFVLVGLPVFLIHWWAARSSGETDEQSAGLRKFYLYANMTAWMATLVVVGLDLLIATLNVVAHLDLDYGGYKPWANLSTLILAGGLWGLHRLWARADAQAVLQSGRGEDVRRFYQYLFAAVGMLLAYTGLGGFISGVLVVLAESWAREFWRETLVPPFSTLVIGVVLALGFWRLIQRKVRAGDESEKSSGLRTLYLHLLIFVFALAALNSFTGLVSDLFQQSLGVADTRSSFWVRMSGPIGLLFSAGLLGFYQTRMVFGDPEMKQGAGWRRAGRYFYTYLMATIGLSMGLLGLIQVIVQVLNRIADTTPYFSGSEWLGILVVPPFVSMGVGFAVWLAVFLMRPSMTRAGGTKAKDRRSLWRRIYVCLFAFEGVAAATYAVGSFIRLIVRLLFGAEAPDPFLAGVSSEIALLLVGGGTWAVFWLLLKGDEKVWQTHLTTEAFRVAVMDGDTSELGQAIMRHLGTELPGATVAPASLSHVGTEMLAGADVIIGSWEIANTPGLADLPAEKVLVPAGQNWSWAGVEPVDLDGLAKHAAQAARQIADGVPVRPEGRLPTYAIAGLVSSLISPLWLLIVFLALLGPVINQIFNEIIWQLGQ